MPLVNFRQMLLLNLLETSENQDVSDVFLGDIEREHWPEMSQYISF